jgi:hypothetical protein
MPTQDRSFVAPPVRSSKRVKASSSRFVESPVKTTKRRNAEDFVSPRRPTKRRRRSDFVEPRTQPEPRTISSTTRDRHRRPATKPRERKNVNSVSLGDGDGGYSDGGGYDGGGLGDSSPEKCHGVMDGIDWSITGDEVDELKSKAIPEYWESLLDSPFGVVRVTERLYILKDWHPLGYLMVTYRYIRLTFSLGTSVQACLQND